MKNFLLAGLVTLQTTLAFAQDLTFADMPARLPNMDQSGKSYSDSYTCSIKTEWLANGDLKVTGTETYKGGKPSKLEIVLTPSKNPEVYTDKYDGSIEYNISQSTVLFEEDDYQVDLYELFSFTVKNSVVTRIQVQVAEVDHESDPHEDSIHCYFENE